MPVASLEAIQGQDALAQQLAVLVVHAEAEDGQVWEYHLGVREDGLDAFLSYGW